MLRDSPAIIHAGDLYPPGVIAMTLKKMLGVPYIIYCHSEELTSTDGYRYQPRVRNQIYLNSDAVVAASKFAKQNLLRVGVPEERIHIISPGVNLARLQCTQSQEELRERYGMKGKLVLLTVGRLISRKGHQLVLRALDKVRSQVPNAHYIIVGKGPEEARLRQTVQEMGLGEHVTFQGLAQEQALADYYNLCDVMVMPNRQEANGDVEGFGMVFLEANAVGKPVVGGRSGGAVEAIADGTSGFLVNPDDPEELAATLVRLLSDRDLRERIGAAGARRVRDEFSWETRARDLRQLGPGNSERKKDAGAASATARAANGLTKGGKRQVYYFGLGLHGLMPLGMYLGAIAAFLLSIFWKPEIGIYYLVPLLPMQTARFWLHAFPLGEKLVDVLLLGVFIGLFFHSERPLFASSPLNKVLIFLFALTYVSLWQGAFYLNVDMPISYLDPRFSDWKNYVEMLIIFFAVAGAIRKPKQMVFLMILMGVSLLVVNRSYHSTIGGRDFSHFDYDLRDAGPLGYAGENGMGAFQSELAVFLVGISAFVKQRTWKLAIWGLTATSIYCLVLTFSRGAYLGFLVGILVLGIIKNRKLLFLLAILLATWQSIVPNAVRERVFMTYTDGQGLDQSAGDRVSLWQDAMTVVDTDPIFGTGYNTYEYMNRVGPYSDTHNYYVKVLLETGRIRAADLSLAIGRDGKNGLAPFPLRRTIHF